jgi:contractile injection system tube protein
MTVPASPLSPRLLKGGIVLLDPESGTVRRVIALQYNPDSLSHSFQIKGAGADSGDRSEALRLKGPPVESIKIEAEIDAADQLAEPASNPNAAQLGVQPQLALFELLIYPASAQLQSNNALARSGTLEIAPMQAPLTLFVWGRNRVVPVRLTELSITEEAFDPSLNPIRAKVSLGMRVLSVDDLGFDHRGGGVFLAYQQQKERLGAKSVAATLAELGIGGIP